MPDPSRPPDLSIRTYRLHLRAEALNTLFLGIFGLYDVVARKALGASDAEVVILVSATPAFSLFGFFWSYVMEGRPKAPFILWAGTLTRGALLLTAVVTGSLPFVLLCCAVFLSEPVYTPALNSIMQANYDPAWRGRLVGRIAFWTRGLMVVGSLYAGWLLDEDPRHYRILFPAAACLGWLAYLQIAMIRVAAPLERVEARPRGLSSFFRALAGFRTILKENPDFDAYERNYFLYGIGFMILLPTQVFLMVEHLQMTYQEMSLAKLVLFHACVALFAPLGGRLFDRMKAVRASGVAFAVLGFFPALLFVSYATRSVAVMYAGYVVYGTAMSTVLTTWSLGAMHFSGRRDAAAFMGVHVTAVGVRGVCAPFIGYVVGKLFNLGVVCLAAAALFWLASLLMFRLARRTEPPRSLEPGFKP